MMSYEDFEKDWLRRHKGSLVSRPRVSSWGLIGGLILWGLIAIGAALVSGAHSVPAILQTIPGVVPTPWREVLSLFGFTIFELLVFAGALYRRGNRYAAWGLLIAMIGALAANIGSSVFAVSEHSGDALNFIVALVLALIAPLAAFLAGEMVYHLYAKHQAILDAAAARYEQKRRDLDAVINREWVRANKSKVSVVEVTAPILPEPVQPAALPTPYGYTRTADGQAKVMDYLDTHPDEAVLPSRKLAEKISAALGKPIGHDTVNKGRNQWIALRQAQDFTAQQTLQATLPLPPSPREYSAQAVGIDIEQ
jgi:uncharacterized membrane protein